jgi:hypothetical protein
LHLAQRRGRDESRLRIRIEVEEKSIYKRPMTKHLLFAKAKEASRAPWAEFASCADGHRVIPNPILALMAPEL